MNKHEMSMLICVWTVILISFIFLYLGYTIQCFIATGVGMVASVGGWYLSLNNYFPNKA